MTKLKFTGIKWNQIAKDSAGWRHQLEQAFTLQSRDVRQADNDDHDSDDDCDDDLKGH